MKTKEKQGFTLIEVLIVIGIIAILTTIVIVAINPSKQFTQANDTRRFSNVNTILNAISQNIVDNKGTFVCSVEIPKETDDDTKKIIGSGSGQYNIFDCIVPEYVAEIPFDPTTGHFSDKTNYDSGYRVFISTETGRIVVQAKGEVDNENNEWNISATR